MKKSKREQGGAEPRRLKRRRMPQPVSFDDCHWGFHEVDPKERPSCLWRELCRQAFLDKQKSPPWPPWLSRNEAQKARDSFATAGQKSPDADWSVRELRAWPRGGFAGKAAIKYDEVSKAVCPQAWEVVRFEIDWTASDPKLKKDFAKWLGVRRKREGSAAWNFKDSTRESSGRPREVDNRLVDLAIYRARKAGYRTTDALNEKLGPLLKVFRTPRDLSAQRIYDACKRVPQWIKETGF